MTATATATATIKGKSAGTEYATALLAVREVGVAHASDEQVMAHFCEHVLKRLVGAASPRLVWEGARKQGMTALQLARLCSTDPMAVHDLMWT